MILDYFINEQNDNNLYWDEEKHGENILPEYIKEEYIVDRYNLQL